MVKLLLIRHGESLSNSGNFLTGRLDVDLTPLGYAQAEATADFLARTYPLTGIVSSTLQRAMHTVEPLAERTGLPITPDAGLREIDGGVFEGMNYEMLRRKYPVEYGHWAADIGTAFCPGGESTGGLQLRAEAALRRIGDTFPDRSVLAIGTHAVFIRALMTKWKDLPLSEMKNVPWVPNASVTEVDYADGCFTIVREGMIDHLGGMITNIPKGV